MCRAARCTPGPTRCRRAGRRPRCRRVARAFGPGPVSAQLVAPTAVAASAAATRFGLRPLVENSTTTSPGPGVRAHLPGEHLGVAVVVADGAERWTCRRAGRSRTARGGRGRTGRPAPRSGAAPRRRCPRCRRPAAGRRRPAGCPRSSPHRARVGAAARSAGRTAPSRSTCAASTAVSSSARPAGCAGGRGVVAFLRSECGEAPVLYPPAALRPRPRPRAPRRPAGRGDPAPGRGHRATPSTAESSLAVVVPLAGTSVHPVAGTGLPARSASTSSYTASVQSAIRSHP